MQCEEKRSIIKTAAAFAAGLFFTVFPFIVAATVTGCQIEEVELKTAQTETLDTQTIACSIEGFYETGDTETKYDSSINFGMVYYGSGYGMVAVPNSSSRDVPVTNHFVYLKNKSGDVAVFKISSSCIAAMSALSNKNITLDYSHTKTEYKVMGTYEYKTYTWNGFELEYEATLPKENKLVETTTEGETLCQDTSNS